MTRVWLLMLIAYCVMDSTLGLKRTAKVLSRRKRYIAFPEGSSFSCAVCMTVGTLGNPAPSSSPGIFTFGLNWGIAYELPNATETGMFYRKKYKRPVAQRRNRRELYAKLESILDNMGYSGRDCVLKTLCETTQRISRRGDNVIQEIFRILFTLPASKVLPTEPAEHLIYDSAHRLGILLQSCDRFNCPLSLVDWALGYYNAPSPSLSMFDNSWSQFEG